MQYHADDGQTVVYNEDVEFTNGRTLDLDGAVVQCSHGRRAVEREGRRPGDGARRPLAGQAARTRRTTSWSPRTGRSGSPTRHTASSPTARAGSPTPSTAGCYVFRLDERRGELTAMITDMVEPNGLAFSPDERILYVSDTGVLRDSSAPGHIRAYDVDRRKLASTAGVFAQITVGGIGRIPGGRRRPGGYGRPPATACGVFTPDGEQLLHVPVPEKVRTSASAAPTAAISTSPPAPASTGSGPPSATPRASSGAATPDARPA